MSASFNLGAPKESAGSLFLRSQFYASVQWPPSDTNLEGKVAIVTGSTGGLGLEASRQLLSFGLSGLIMAVRSTTKGEEAAAKFRAQYPRANIQVWPLEMESYDSIQAIVRRAETELPRLDIAILNAAMQTATFSIVRSTGHEKYIQVNYLSTMLLAILLLPVLKAKSPPGMPGRLTIVSSGTARGATITELKDAPILPAFDGKSRPWNPFSRYAISKLLAHLFVIDLVRYVSADDVIVNLVDPGLVKNTDLQRGAPLPLAAFFYCLKTIFGRRLPVGASTYVDAAVVKGKETHGCYVADWKISSFAAFVYTSDGEAIREQLWKETMVEFEFVGVESILSMLKK
ncbi:NAD(P)-binding protein [Rhizodiscina lignyota]|uniref:NAD(P)-binding protein n=1 Tax=Rhizodiscina lignyota TaxID=1504668 RepID=A0A9P4I7H3_9PEZI|nr:NAD(P)-binding protein [Rhizodiscina lignyota]